MKRRKFIGIIAFFSGISITGYHLYDIFSKRDLEELNRNKKLIAQLAELIIPRTNTVGAIDVKAEETIILFLEKCTERGTQNNFIRGLTELKAYATSKFGNDFLECTLDQQSEVLLNFEEKSKSLLPIWGKLEKRFLGRPFFTVLKEYTTIAYCTSKDGASQGMAYNAIPGNFISCINLMKGQKSWATK